MCPRKGTLSLRNEHLKVLNGSRYVIQKRLKGTRALSRYSIIAA